MLEDIPIYLDGEEIVERPRFSDGEELASYIAKISEGRDIDVVVEHPHDDESRILSVHIGIPSDYKCPHGCDGASGAAQ